MSIVIIRKLEGKSYYYNDPDIIEQTLQQIKFFDSKSGKEITLPTSDYQIEERRQHGEPKRRTG